MLSTTNIIVSSANISYTGVVLSCQCLVIRSARPWNKHSLHRLKMKYACTKHSPLTMQFQYTLVVNNYTNYFHTWKEWSKTSLSTTTVYLTNKKNKQQQKRLLQHTCNTIHYCSLFCGKVVLRYSVNASFLIGSFLVGISLYMEHFHENGHKPCNFCFWKPTNSEFVICLSSLYRTHDQLQFTFTHCSLFNLYWVPVIGPQTFLYGSCCVQSVLPRPQASSPQYGSHTQSV